MQNIPLILLACAMLSLGGHHAAAAASDDHGAAHQEDGHGGDHDDHDDHDHDEDVAAHEDDHGAEDAAHSFAAHGLKIVHPWMNATSGRETLIYMTIENAGGSAVTITGADVPFAGAATLAGFVLRNGEGVYEPLPGVPVQPGRDLDLAPQGLAIRATDLSRSFAQGDSAQIVVHTSAGDLEITVAVEAADATQHSHAGHAH